MGCEGINETVCRGSWVVGSVRLAAWFGESVCVSFNETVWMGEAQSARLRLGCGPVEADCVEVAFCVVCVRCELHFGEDPKIPAVC